MSDHERFHELISQYIDGTLDADREAELHAHLSGCEECRELLRILTGVRETLDFEKEPPEALVTGVMEGVERIDKTRGSVKLRRFGFAASLAAVAAALALVLFPKSEDPSGADTGIAPYSNGDSAIETRDVADQGRTVSLFPDDPVALSVDTNVRESVESFCADFYAVARFDTMPDDIAENGGRYLFSDGSVGFEISRALFDKYLGEAVRVDYPDEEGEKIMAVFTPTEN